MSDNRPPLVLRRRQTQKVREGALSHNIDYDTQVSANLLDGRIFSIGGAASGRFCDQRG